MKIFRFFIVVFFFVAAALAAEPAGTDSNARLATARKLVESLKPQRGEVTLNGGIARIKVPEDFRYLSAADADTVLVKLWGNPGNPGTLGLLVPAGFNPLYEDSWAVVITYDESGYVKDDDAATINYDKLMTDMKAGTIEANREREKQGYHPVELVGWATPPRYDKAAHKLYWAKELKFGDGQEHTLNYNIRMLGRRGVLVLNAVAGMSQLKTVEAAAPKILTAVNFQEGHRYVDFDGSKDKVAAYGLAALVAGGIAAKAGFFKLFWIALLAAKKFIVIGVLAIGSFIKKLFSSRTSKSPFTAQENPPPAPPPNPSA